MDALLKGKQNLNILMTAGGMDSKRFRQGTNSRDEQRKGSVA